MLLIKAAFVWVYKRFPYRSRNVIKSKLLILDTILGWPCCGDNKGHKNQTTKKTNPSIGVVWTFSTSSSVSIKLSSFTFLTPLWKPRLKGVFHKVIFWGCWHLPQTNRGGGTEAGRHKHGDSCPSSFIPPPSDNTRSKMSQHPVKPGKRWGDVCVSRFANTCFAAVKNVFLL